jgi:hypothetical protein
MPGRIVSFCPTALVKTSNQPRNCVALIINYAEASRGESRTLNERLTFVRKI